MPLKLGKALPKHDKRSLFLASYRKALKTVKVPATFGVPQLKAVKDWGMLGNDQYGDCVWAGAAHETMLWASEAKRKVLFNASCVLSDYSAVTGFNPNDPNSDQGTAVLDAMNYRRNTGIVDSSGKRHQICAFAQLEPGNYQELLEAAYTFSAVGIGIQVPSSAMDQFDQGKPWSVTSAPIEGGHYIPVVGKRNGHLLVLTWGKVQEMTKSFYEKYADEGFVIFDDEMLSDTGTDFQGWNMAALQADFQSITGKAA